MTSRTPRPPPAARRLLSAARLGVRRADVQADLEELFAARCVEHGARYARRRFYADVLSVVLRRRASTERRSRSLDRSFAGLAADLVYASRLFRRYPTLVLGAVLSLGLTIGAGTSVFSVLNANWIRPYLAADASTVRIWGRAGSSAWAAWPEPEVRELGRLSTLVTIEATVDESLSLAAATGTDDKRSAPIAFVTGGYLAAFGPAPAVGRLLQPSDDAAGATPVAVLSHLAWRRRFGADAAMVGRTIRIGASPVLVVGVAGRDFVDPGMGAEPAAWVPLAAVDRVAPESGTTARVQAIGRLARGVTNAQAETALARLLPQLPVPARPLARRPTSVELGPVDPPSELGQVRLVVVVVLGVIALMLLLACANVSNLLLAGAATRQEEIGVRLALGAGRARVARQMITESLLLAGAAALVGRLCAVWLAPVLAAYAGSPGADVDPDLRVYAFLAVTLLVSAVGAGLAPARYAARRELTDCLKGARLATPAGPGRLRSVLVGGQAAASILLVVLAALLVRALAHVSWQDPGFDVDHLLAVSARVVSTRDAIRGVPEAEARAAAYWRSAIERVRRIAGTRSVALGVYPPFDVSLGDPSGLLVNQTDAGYFAVVGLRVLRGRTYSADEVSARSPVAVVSRQVAVRYWGRDDPIGASLARVNSRVSAFHVIGVVNDPLTEGLAVRTPMLYVPMASYSRAQLVVRGRDPRALAGPVAEALVALPPHVQPSVTVVSDRFAREFQRPRAFATLALGLAMLALGLSVAGLYGVTGFVVRTRAREIGIRMAMGARRTDVIRQIARESMRPVVTGLAIGLAVALLAGRVMAGVLYGVSARDPLAILAAVATLVAAALAAIVLPARRAARLDPAAVLREG